MVDVGELEAVLAKDLLGRYDQTLRELGALIGSIEKKITLKGKSRPMPVED